MSLHLADHHRTLTGYLTGDQRTNSHDLLDLTAEEIWVVRRSVASLAAVTARWRSSRVVSEELHEDDSQVQLCSMFMFRELLYFLPEGERKAMKSHVRKSLLPLFFHCHDENQRVAEASGETLHCSATFLHRKDLQDMLQLDQTWRFGESLLAEGGSRAAEHVRHALQYLESPQESLRQAAIRFIGMAGRHLRAHKRELRHIRQALEDKAEDISPSCRSLALETAFVLQAVERAPCSILQRLQDRFRRACKERPCLWGHGWLCCCSSEES